jgi:hypothetical protein
VVAGCANRHFLGREGMILNLVIWFGHKVLLTGGDVDLLAAVSAAVSMVLMQKFHIPITVPIRAVAA